MTSLALTRDGVLALIRALLADELKTLRNLDGQAVHSDDWQWSTHISPAPSGGPGESSLNADSLELVALATRVSAFFQLPKSGIEDYLLRQRTLGDWCDLVLKARELGSRDLTFTTSGSTGAPKPCPHNWDALAQEVRFFAHVLEADQPRRRRLIAPTPCHHIYGCLFSVLLAEQLALPVVRDQAALALMLGGGLRSGDLVIGIPYLWEQFARQGLAFPRGLVGISSTAPTDPSLFTRLRALGLERLIEIYGASETAGVGWRDDGAKAFELLPRWHRWEGESQRLHDGTGAEPIALMDELQWPSSRQFYPQGRRDRAVQVGGINVYPARVARRLETLPDVARAEVRLMNPAEGSRLKAFIVPAHDQDTPASLQERLQQWCECHLSPPERPRAFRFGAQLPTNTLNKLSDWEI